MSDPGEGTAFHPDALRSALLARVPAAAANPASVEIVRAPGRVNLIGEHTDYNDGFVLPAAIDLEIRMAIVPTDDRRVEVTLLADGTRHGFDLDAIPAAAGRSIDYVAGVAWSLGEAGLPMRGFRAVLASNLPMSSGLSSSAALELAGAWALLEPAARPAGDDERMLLARTAQRAENEHVGVRCGLMDQFASSLGRPGAAMLLDCRSLEYRAVPLPLSDHALVLCDSAAPRQLAASAYNARRAQCEEAVAVIAAEVPSVRSLRDVDRAMLAAFADRLDAETARRVEHVVGENERVLECVAALEAGDLVAVGHLFAASHRSLRELYEVSSAELDALVEIAGAVPGTAAARMTGAGFGGCTVNLVATDAHVQFVRHVSEVYARETGESPVFHVARASAGANEIRSGAR